ncbi:MAG: hypothetical protein L0229_01010 [Blastocatellia bacterium]|nr:hypothetical protein [Blastocatellia bacterium]
MIEQVKEVCKSTWECKECHRAVAAEETVAFHLVDQVLYGWCESCFNRRAKPGSAEIAA